MPGIPQQNYAFTLRDEKTEFLVVRFRGEEEISRPYRFDIDLATEDLRVEAQTLVGKQATLRLLREEGEVRFHGLISSFEETRLIGERLFCRAVLVPRIWGLTLTRRNNIFLGKSLAIAMAETLRQTGLFPGKDFEFHWEAPSATKEYVCQYDESDFDFFSRGAELLGLRYHFEQGETVEKLVVSGSLSQPSPAPSPPAPRAASPAASDGPLVRFAGPSCLADPTRSAAIWAFSARTSKLPAKVLVREYNPETPHLAPFGSQEVDPEGQGEYSYYGDNISTPDLCQRMAACRAEQLRGRGATFHGQGNTPWFSPGYVFALEAHSQGAYNRPYLLTRVVHEGSQEAWLARLGWDIGVEAPQSFYRNSFECLPHDVIFRPERRTPTPKVHGALLAQIDAEGSGQYAELDAQGRYKVRMRFDQSGRKDGKASTFLRKLEPYAGDGHGMHFPLHKGTAVLVTCIGGDPNHPVIVAALPDPLHPSPVRDVNQTMSALTTKAQNKIHIEDAQGSERMLLQSPTKNTFLRIGNHNDPPAGPASGDDAPVNGQTFFDPGDAGIYLCTNGYLTINAQTQNTLILGESSSIVCGAESYSVIGGYVQLVLGANLLFTLALAAEFDLTRKVAVHTVSTDISWDEMELADIESEMAALETTVTETKTAIHANKANFSGAKSTIAAAEKKEVSAKTAVTYAEQKLEAAVEAVKGQVSTFAEKQTDAIVTLTKTVGEKSLAVVEMNENVAEASAAYAQVSTISTATTTTSLNNLTM